MFHIEWFPLVGASLLILIVMLGDKGASVDQSGAEGRATGDD